LFSSNLCDNFVSQTQTNSAKIMKKLLITSAIFILGLSFKSNAQTIGSYSFSKKCLKKISSEKLEYVQYIHSLKEFNKIGFLQLDEASKEKYLVYIEYIKSVICTSKRNKNQSTHRFLTKETAVNEIIWNSIPSEDLDASFDFPKSEDTYTSL
jgi:hypothetical protein